MANKTKKNYIQSFGEEVGNSISHGVMSILTLLALPFAAVWAWVRSGGSVQTVVGVSVFCISIFFMFLISTLYHAMSPDSRHKQVFHILDHIFIYVAIAGSYTPVALDVIGGWQGTLIVIVQWAMVVFGVFYKSLSTKSIPAISLTIYLIMGWTIVFFLPLFLSNATPLFMTLIAVGGVLYTAGAVIYAMKGFKYHHLVWHLFIDLAAASHFVAIVFFLWWYLFGIVPSPKSPPWRGLIRLWRYLVWHLFIDLAAASYFVAIVFFLWWYLFGIGPSPKEAV